MSSEQVAAFTAASGVSPEAVSSGIRGILWVMLFTWLVWVLISLFMAWRKGEQPTDVFKLLFLRSVVLMLVVGWFIA